MSARTTFNASLTPGLHAFSTGRLGLGRHGNVSEVLRAALSLLDERGLEFDEHRKAAINAAELDAC